MMELIEEKQIQRRIETSDLLSASAAKAQLASMINSGELLKIFGSEIAGVPTETVLAITQAQIFCGGGIL